MLRIAPIGSNSQVQVNVSLISAGLEINIMDTDQFVSAEPARKPESRRGWRRRRIRRGKS